MKYIIKNCPALFTSKGKTFLNDCCNEPSKKTCKDITDCLMKQIVERADICLCPEVVELLEIEEVE